LIHPHDLPQKNILICKKILGDAEGVIGGHREEGSGEVSGRGSRRF